MSTGFQFRRGAQRVRICLGLVVTLSAAACAPSPDSQAPTVEYFRTHRDARQEQLIACENDPGRLARSAACVNAQAAARLEDVGSLRDLPPMGLPQARHGESSTPKPPDGR